MVTQCVVGVLFHVEAVSLTCDDDDDDDTTYVCPDTELTCTCSVNSTSDNSGLIWRLPVPGMSETITLAFDNKAGVGSNKTTTDGIFVAVVTNNTGGVLESMLIYTATESLVDGTIECEEQGDDRLRSVFTIADIAG